MIRVSAFYAYEEGAQFDFEYYRNRHFPLVASLMKPYGLIRYEIDRGLSSRSSAKPDFVAIGHMILDSLEEWGKGLSIHGEQILADVKNYTNLSPRVQYSEVL